MPACATVAQAEKFLEGKVSKVKVGRTYYDAALWEASRQIALMAITAICEPGWTMIVPEQNIIARAKKIYPKLEAYCTRLPKGETSLTKPDGPCYKISFERSGDAIKLQAQWIGR